MHWTGYTIDLPSFLHRLRSRQGFCVLHLDEPLAVLVQAALGRLRMYLRQLLLWYSNLSINDDERILTDTGNESDEG
jgi:hypothetical protein